MVSVESTPTNGRKRSAEGTGHEIIGGTDINAIADDNLKKSISELHEGPVRKKSKKHLKKPGKEKDQPHVHETKGQGKALGYLDTWANDRAHWKFEKCRQIWLIQNCYNNEKIPEKTFETLLLYLGSIKGRMRELVIGMLMS